MVRDDVAGGGDGPPGWGEFLKVWALIGVMSFGGPAGQIALMHRELVERRRWIGEERFLHALNYCMLLPGPEAQQLATYVGWLMRRTAGGLAAGLLFILPGALVMLGLSALYVTHAGTPVADGLLYGIKAAVLAVVAEAVLRIGRRALKQRWQVAVALLSFGAIVLLSLPFPLLVLAAGLSGAALNRSVAPGPVARDIAAGDRPEALADRLMRAGRLPHAIPSSRRLLLTLAVGIPVWLAPLGLAMVLGGPDSVFTDIAGYFGTLALVTFGGAYAALASVAQAAVSTYGWLTPGQMIDGLGLAETTPGPLVLVLQHVGFLAAHGAAGPLAPLAAGTLGALLASWMTFAPSFLFILAGGPHVEALRRNRRLAAALSAITAAVVGVIAALALWFGIHVLFRETFVAAATGITLPVPASFDPPAALIAVAAGMLLLRVHAALPAVLVGAALAGAALHGFAPL